MKKDNKKALYEAIMTSVAKEVKKALNESSDDYYEDDENSYEDEGEWVTYGDVINSMDGIDPQDIIDSNGQIIEDIVLDNIMYPENGANIALTAVQLAEEMVDNELTYEELCDSYRDDWDEEI